MDNSVTIKNLAENLKLSTFEEYGEYVKPDMSIEEALIELMSQECVLRHDKLVTRRINDAGLPNGKTIDTFKFAPGIPHLKKEHVEPLLSCQFIEDKMNCCALGGSGTGKTHLMSAIGRVVVQKGYTVKFIRVSELVTMLSEASTEKSLGKMMKKLLKVSLLCLDELCEALHNSSHVKRF